jgi:hypothetical protein
MILRFPTIDVKDVAKGVLVDCVKDKDGNILGFLTKSSINLT